jgi:hypothetical protein
MARIAGSRGDAGAGHVGAQIYAVSAQILDLPAMLPRAAW